MHGALTRFDLLNNIIRRFLLVLAILQDSGLPPVLAIPLACCQLVWQQELAPVELVQQ